MRTEVVHIVQVQSPGSNKDTPLPNKDTEAPFMGGYNRRKLPIKGALVPLLGKGGGVPLLGPEDCRSRMMKNNMYDHFSNTVGFTTCTVCSYVK